MVEPGDIFEVRTVFEGEDTPPRVVLYPAGLGNECEGTSVIIGEAHEGLVYLIGPESKVYHRTAYCPALRGDMRYWPTSRGLLKEHGVVDLLDGFGSYQRRPCKRCHK